MMPTAAPRPTWDYTELAKDYDNRPGYDEGLVREVLDECGVAPGSVVLEVGAGTGKLTALLLGERLRVLASEPNAAMRAVALAKPSVRQAAWLAALGEALPVRAAAVDLVAYGSSFNVLDARAALDECARVLRPGGHWLALWNHRDLHDPLQAEVEACIRRHVPGYDYGSRRVDPDAAVRQHRRFGHFGFAERRMVVRVQTAAWLAAWRSHATLARQAGGALDTILRELRAIVGAADVVEVPYFTRAWLARKTGP
jgi:SAM-dependent methyltransferase